MALSKTHRIIWLDAFIGQPEECIEFKRRFVRAIEEDSRYGDQIDACIQAIEENAAPFIFLHENEQVFDRIKRHSEKKLIFISSGSLGKGIIPQIHPAHLNVYAFYIFCAITANYVDLVIDYAQCLQIFNHELDLLVRLMRDISLEIIREGEAYLELGEPAMAKDFFERSRKLELAANFQDKLNMPFMGHLRKLGDEENPGLIQRAERELAEQNASVNTDATPSAPRDSDAVQEGDDPDSEEESPHALEAAGTAYDREDTEVYGAIVNARPGSPVGEEAT